MSPSRPFFDAVTGDLDTAQILHEAVPLAKLVAAVGAAALVPLLVHLVLVEMLALLPGLGVLLTLASQFVLAVGTSVVLLYVVVRGNQLVDE